MSIHGYTCASKGHCRAHAGPPSSPETYLVIVSRFSICRLRMMPPYLNGWVGTQGGPFQCAALAVSWDMTFFLPFLSHARGSERNTVVVYTNSYIHGLLSFKAEAAIALRQRLNETVNALDALKKEHVELETKFENQNKELTIAKSDRTKLLVNLVNKDQLEILATLRESVNDDKLGLESDMEKLRKQNRDLSDKNKSR
ncbi:hypothetical protein JB92DRAFT_3102134 [Gautieria morchelliformis]|nr:hypothetical protein JB92DRAFT_3102134 [Gautieria morchelliformis]